MVFIQYDATKSRDRSHYERFRSYHESYYRFVEPTGATPFSKPARERALHAVLTSIIRQKRQIELANDKDAGCFDIKNFNDAICEAEQFILERIAGINACTKSKLKDDIGSVKVEMQEFIEHWQELVDECSCSENKVPLYFGRKFMVAPPGVNEYRLLKPYNTFSHDTAVETLTSMRNVDIPVTGSIVIWED